jgi:murein DD-endopeptidase MepM/ murein hydrolase activator NlpD
MFQVLFPQYTRHRWVRLPLGTLALEQQEPGQPNPLLDAHYCEKWVRQLHRRYHADFSYGGWFEDRSTLWRGHYMARGSIYHLGIDFNVPENSRVHSPTVGKVAQVLHDTDLNGGWGGRLIIELKPRFRLVLAHLGKVYVRDGEKVRPGQLLGSIGGPANNGNWYPPHLHVQLVRGSFGKIDGYGGISSHNQRKFPDPSLFWPPPQIKSPPPNRTIP